jgi:hypothetical protein
MDEKRQLAVAFMAGHVGQVCGLVHRCAKGLGQRRLLLRLDAHLRDKNIVPCSTLLYIAADVFLHHHPTKCPHLVLTVELKRCDLEILAVS